MNKSKKIDFEEWDRTAHFRFFMEVGEGAPVGSVTSILDVTHAYAQAKARGVSFFLYYLYYAIKVSNEIVNFRYRLDRDNEGGVVEYPVIGSGITVARPDHSFGFCYISWIEDFDEFCRQAYADMEIVRQGYGLTPNPRLDLTYITVTPKLFFTSLTFSRSRVVDVPRIAFGKCEEREGRMQMPLSISYHHGFIDGYHLGLYVETLQRYLAQ